MFFEFLAHVLLKGNSGFHVLRLKILGVSFKFNDINKLTCLLKVCSEKG